MELVTLEVSVPKEMQEISVFIAHLIKDIKAKKAITEIVAGSLPGLMTAVDGYGQLSEEIKSDEATDCIALLGSGVYKALKG